MIPGAVILALIALCQGGVLPPMCNHTVPSGRVESYTWPVEAFTLDFNKSPVEMAMTISADQIYFFVFKPSGITFFEKINTNQSKYKMSLNGFWCAVLDGLLQFGSGQTVGHRILYKSNDPYQGRIQVSAITCSQGRATLKCPCQPTTRKLGNRSRENRDEMRSCRSATAADAEIIDD
ncbi:hypothetical protein CAPTEDRAFT_189676 [Capitella teleta]|uniref:Uncharacterized protein n=1 Tax=Capitella teleta TaxID=283909 RepID=R7TKK9_CAPTE|nr:hypothetical protein CAPTEDRAFT_189676 [Capitella teleta]|eukprot:ELT94318.1 hypothetical protein CAPTEDRAFT_189676 [Capitella teleta]